MHAPRAPAQNDPEKSPGVNMHPWAKTPVIPCRSTFAARTTLITDIISYRQIQTIITMTSETDKSKEKIPSYTDHGCFLLPKGFPVEGFKSGLAYEAQGEHIIIF